MLACIPTNGKTGLDDTVSDHFGSAPYFTLYDSSKDEFTVVENRNAHHSHGTCHPMNQLARYHIDCVVCSGMGRRAIEALNSEGVKVYHSGSESVREAVDRIKSEELAEMDPAKSCRGHGQKSSSFRGLADQGGLDTERGQEGWCQRGSGGQGHGSGHGHRGRRG